MLMSELRRQKRKATRESVKAITNTKIDDGLASALDGYLTDDRYFKKQVAMCQDLGLDLPTGGAKSGYELPLFNKNPMTNEIEIHGKSAELFAAYQLTVNLVDSTIGMDDESDEYAAILVLLGVIDQEPSFAQYLHDLVKIGEEKGFDMFTTINNNIEEISKKIEEIVVP